jgi:hypothetical protein
MLFRHADGRVMKRTQAGGTGGGVTSHFDELATAEEVAAFAAQEAKPEAPLPTDTAGQSGPGKADDVVPETGEAGIDHLAGEPAAA